MIDGFSEYEQVYERILGKIGSAESILIVPHDFPDPDAIGASVGLQHIFREIGIPRCDIAFSGFVGRAENRAMIELLEIVSFNLSKIDISSYDVILSVDSLPGNGNVSISDVSMVDIVIDHHPVTDLEELPGTLYEIHTDVGATSTLVTLLSIAAGVELTPKCAAALFFGIKTDTNDMARNCHNVDIFCYKYLFDRIEHGILSQIEFPQRDEEYFLHLHSAAEDLKIFGNMACTHLGIVTVPDFVPEMADIFHSLKEIEWMVCSAVFGDLLIYSVRSKKEITAGDCARKIALRFGGTGGGHPTMAAGRIPLTGADGDLAGQFTEVLCEVLDIKGEKPRRIVKM